jgi:hypothetical protein
MKKKLRIINARLGASRPPYTPRPTPHHNVAGPHTAFSRGSKDGGKVGGGGGKGFMGSLRPAAKALCTSPERLLYKRGLCEK